MNINIDKIKEIYGENSLYEIKNNLDNVINNVNYLIEYNIKNIEEILECYPYIFLMSEEEFKTMIDNYIKELGINYQEELEQDMSLWGRLQ